MTGASDLPSADCLRGLARKYTALAALRGRRDGAGPAAARAELRALAEEFPGCLRELDTLGAAELARRAAACGAARGGGPVEPWMLWIDGYHTLMRQALAARRGRAAGQVSDTDDDFHRAVLSPPGGRMGVVVLRALALRFGVPAATIAGTLFPPRRPRPYQL